MHALQVRLWSDSLIQTLLPSNRTIREELELWQCREFRLSPKDHWEVNGILGHLEEWNSLPYASILAVFGPTLERDSWVTEFILDTIQAFQVQNELVTFVMCDRPDEEHYNPLILIKTIICQILEQRPSLILEEPELFSSRIFQRTQNFDQACVLLQNIIARLDHMVLLIDRIDRCQSDTSESDEDLPEFLIQLVRNYGKKLKVIVTSTDFPPEDLPDNLPISVCQISAFKAQTEIHRKRPPRQTLLLYDYGAPAPWITAAYYGVKNPNAMLYRYWPFIAERRPTFGHGGGHYHILRRKDRLQYRTESLDIFAGGSYNGLYLNNP